ESVRSLSYCTSAALALFFFFFFSSRRRHTRSDRDWSSDVCSSDLVENARHYVDTGLPSDYDGKRVIIIGKRNSGFELAQGLLPRSEERRVGKECRSGWWPDHEKKKKKENRALRRLMSTQRQKSRVI